MARGATLQEMVSDLRDELRRANSPSASPDDVASLRRTLNHVYWLMYYQHNWSFLEYRFPAITLNAGQRYYDVPVGLDADRIIEAKVKWSSDFIDVSRGIEFADYNAYDPEENERTSPMLKWDVVFTGTKEQIEVWPLPDGTAQSLRLFGVYRCDPLVNDTDVCRIDSEIVVLFAAAELLKAQKSEDADAKLQMANELLRLVKIRSTGAGASGIRLGLGKQDAADRPHPRATVRISG